MDEIHGTASGTVAGTAPAHDAVAGTRPPASTSILSARRIRDSVEITAITDDDVAAVADFLHVNLNDQVPWAQSCVSTPWHATAPNHGFMLRDGQRVVGALLALYSARLVAGRSERFCNLGSWCVLPEYRSCSMSLLKAILGQEDYTFTVLTPDAASQEILAWLGFHVLDTEAAAIPNLPWPALPGQTKVSSDPAVIGRTLTGKQLALYRDHADALAARHLVLTRGTDSCYVIWREARYGKKPVAQILHVSNSALFRRSLPPLARHLLIRHRLVATLAELRVVDYRPYLSVNYHVWPKMYRSTNLSPEQIDYLYSELVCVPW